MLFIRFSFWYCSPCSSSDGVSTTCVVWYRYFKYVCICILPVLFMFFFLSDIIHHTHLVIVLLCHVICSVITLIIFFFFSFISYMCVLLILTLSTMLIQSWCECVVRSVVSLLWLFFPLSYMCVSNILHDAHSMKVRPCYVLFIHTLIILLSHLYVIYALLILTLTTMLFQWWYDLYVCTYYSNIVHRAHSEMV